MNEIDHEQFKSLLFKLGKCVDLSDSAEKRVEFYKEFEKIYHINGSEDNYRHFYSDIFYVLAAMKEDPSLGDSQVLAANIEEISNNYQAKNKDNDILIDIKPCLRKLYDHISLEIARMDYSDKGDLSLSNNGTTLNVLDAKIKEIEKKSDKIKHTLSKAQIDYIAILGIFSSVVLAFIGGMTFSTSVLNNIASVTIYRLITTISLIGIVFSTIIFFLFHYIAIITDKYKTGKWEFAKSFIPLSIVYLFFILVIVFTLISWNRGAVEHRNYRISSNRYFEETAISEESTTLIPIE